MEPEIAFEIGDRFILQYKLKNLPPGANKLEFENLLLFSTTEEDAKLEAEKKVNEFLKNDLPAVNAGMVVSSAKVIRITTQLISRINIRDIKGIKKKRISSP